MSYERLTRSELQRLLEQRLRDVLGCREARIIVRWGEPTGAGWTVELAGLPVPRHCREEADRLAAELRPKYRLAKERLASADVTAILVNETLAELGPGWRAFPPPPRPVLQQLPAGIGVPNWTAILAGPVSIEYQQAFVRALERLQGQIDLVS